MQNTIVKEFAGNPNVVAVIFNQGGAQNETREWLEVFWSNYYLRGGVIFDEIGTIGQQAYGQPSIGLPFGRGFIIDVDGRVDRPYFGHQPAMAIARIHELLGTTAVDGAAPGGSAGENARGLRLQLGAGMPNPFRHAAAMSFTLPAPGHARLVIHDVGGRRVRTLVDGWCRAGRHLATWDGTASDGRDVAAGVYFLRLQAADEVRVRKWVKVESR